MDLQQDLVWLARRDFIIEFWPNNQITVFRYGTRTTVYAEPW